MMFKFFNPLRVYLAKKYAKLYKDDVFIAVAGSVGKTTCAIASAVVLSSKYKTIFTDNFIKTILSLKPSIKKAILEINVEHPGQMDFYLSLVTPKTVIVTGISYGHNDSLGSIDDIFFEHEKLVESLSSDGVAILNYDDVNSRKLSKLCKGEVIFYGTDPKNCVVWAGNIRLENFKLKFELNYGVERALIECSIFGLHQIYPLLAASVLGLSQDISLTKIKIALESLKPIDHKMQLVYGPNGSIIIDDTSNSSYAAFESSLDTLMHIPARRRIIVFGEMHSLGKYSEKLHRLLAERIYKEKIDLVFLSTGETSFIADELKSLGFYEERVYNNMQNSQIVSKLLKNTSKGDIILIKGSRSARLDEVVSRIAKK